MDMEQFLCPICQSILEKPIKTPCGHVFCLTCFRISCEETSFNCSICKRRLSVWWRRHPNKEELIDKSMWKTIQKKFPEEIIKKNLGEATTIPSSVRHTIAPNGLIGKELTKQLKDFESELNLIKKKQEEESKKLIRQILNEDKKANANIIITRSKKAATGPMDRYISVGPKDNCFRPINVAPKTPPKNYSSKRAISPDQQTFNSQFNLEKFVSLSSENSAFKKIKTVEHTEDLAVSDLIAEHLAAEAKLRQQKEDYQLAKRLSQTWSNYGTRRNAI